MDIAANLTPKSANLSFVITHELLTMRLFLDSLANYNFRMDHPKVSIIVPIYKVPEVFLRQCIESLINQTLNEIEIILVDDGSPDECGKICDEYASKDNRINVIHKQNGGLVSARNAGYEVVTGKWHMYLDGDDWIDLDTCEKLMERVSDDSEIDVVFWKHIQEFNGKQIVGKLEWSCHDKEHLYIGNDCKELAKLELRLHTANSLIQNMRKEIKSNMTTV